MALSPIGRQIDIDIEEMQRKGWPIKMSHEGHCRCLMGAAIILCDCNPVAILEVTEEETHEHL